MKKIKLDGFEKKIDAAIDRALKEGTFGSQLTPKSLKEIQEAAARPPRLIRKDKRFNIRMNGNIFESLKIRAAAEGMPYQTLVAFLATQFATGKLAIKFSKT